MNMIARRTQRYVFAAFEAEWELRVLRDGHGEPVQVAITPVLDERGCMPARLLAAASAMDFVAVQFNEIAHLRGGWVAAAAFAAILASTVAVVRPGYAPGMRAIASTCALGGGDEASRRPCGPPQDEASRRPCGPPQDEDGNVS